MSWLIISTIYGIGFGICLIGGTVWLMILAGLNTPNLPLLRILLAIIGWPITFAYLGYKGYQMYRDAEDYHQKYVRETKSE